MKRVVYFVLSITLLLAGCAPATEIAVPTSNIAVNSSEISTSTPPPTVTEAPTKTPIIPTATFTPLEAVPISASPLTLTEFNAGTEMKRLNIIGTGTAHDLEFSPDGKRFAIATGRGIYLYEGSTFEQNNFIDVNASVSAIAFSPDGNVLAVAVEGKASLWNVNSGQQMMSLDGELVSIYRLVYGFGGYVAAIGGTCRGCGSPQIGVILWDAKTGRQIFSQRDIWFSTTALMFTSDGKQLIFGGGGIRRIETETGELIASNDSGNSLISAAIDAPYDFIFNNDETQLFVTSYSESSEVFDLTTQARTPFPLCSVKLVSNGRLGACSKEQEIVIFDLTSGDKFKGIEIDIDASSLGGMFVLSPDSNFLVYYGRTGVNIIEISTEEEIAKIQLTDYGVAESGLIDIDGEEKYVVATLTYSGAVEIYDVQTGELLRELKLDCCEIKGFNYAPDRKTFATIETKSLKFWNLQSSNIIYEIALKNDYSGPIAFSPDGNSIFLTDATEIIELDLQAGKTINHGQNNYGYVYADPYAIENYHFNSFGNLVTLGYEKRAEDYYPSFKDEVTDEKIIFPYNAYPDPLFIEAFSLSSDGKYIAFGNIRETLVWDIASMKLQSKFIGHERRSGDGWYGRIKYLMFSAHSNLLVSVGWDGTIRLWSARFGNELRRLNVCCSADFSPDGRYLITYGNGVAYVWGIPQ